MDFQLAAMCQKFMRFFQSGWWRLGLVFFAIWLSGTWGAYIYAGSLLHDSNLRHKDQYLDSIPISLIVRCADGQSKSDCKKNVKRKIAQSNGHVLLMRVGSDQLDEVLVSQKYAEALGEALDTKRASIKVTFILIGALVPILVLLGVVGIYWVMCGFKNAKTTKNRMFTKYDPGRGAWGKYIKVKWRHNLKSAPVELYSELDENRYQLRKIEKYRNGQLDFADGSRNSGSIRLDEVPVPPIQEINEDTQFKASLISKEEFEAVWQKAP